MPIRTSTLWFVEKIMKMLPAALILAVGVLLGYLLRAPSPVAVAGQPTEACKVSLGQLNADPPSEVDITDAVYILNFLFLGGQPPHCPWIDEIAQLRAELDQANSELAACQADLAECRGEPAENGLLPDTGQTLCHDQSGTEIPCDCGICPGQDSFYATGCPPENRFVDNGDGTVTDTCTNLMWQKDTGNAGIRVNWCSALAVCENLSFAGHDDWRLPNHRELESIVKYTRHLPLIDPIFEARAETYWSSTNVDGEDFEAWSVNFDLGGSPLWDKVTPQSVRAVRGIR